MTVDDRIGDVTTSRAMLRFAFPTIVVMVCISSYNIVDGMIVSNMIGTDALAGLNIVMPAASLFTAFGFMLSTGGSAYVAKKLGEGKVEEARRDFTGVAVIGVLIAFAALIILELWLDEIVSLMGADEVLHGYASEYLGALAWFAPIIVLQFIFMQFLIVAGRPGLSLAGSVLSGLTNIVLDVVFINMGMGMAGAAIASGIGSIMAFSVAVAYFVLKKDSPVRFARPSFAGTMVVKVCSNGASEMVTELSGSVTTLLFNLTMMAYLGAAGVSSITIIMYVQFLAIAVILGYSMGVAPLMSYNLGAGRRDVMGTLFRTSLRLVGVVSVSIFVLMELFGWAVVGLFAGGSQEVTDIAVRGAMIHSTAYLFMGFNCYVSSLFTSLNNGLLSALVSFIRGLCLLAPMIVLLPLVFGTDGIWLAVPVTEIATAVVSIYFVLRKGPCYGYLEKRVTSA